MLAQSGFQLADPCSQHRILRASRPSVIANLVWPGDPWHPTGTLANRYQHHRVVINGVTFPGVYTSC